MFSLYNVTSDWLWLVMSDSGFKVFNFMMLDEEEKEERGKGER